jgi:hypothetical protein
MDRKLPKLRLHHLFTLTAVAAALLTAGASHAQSLTSLGDILPSWLGSLLVGMTIISLMMNAVAITFVIYGASGVGSASHSSSIRVIGC